MSETHAIEVLSVAAADEPARDLIRALEAADAEQFLYTHTTWSTLEQTSEGPLTGSSEPDVVVLDLALEGDRKQSLLASLRERFPGLPLVIIDDPDRMAAADDKSAGHWTREQEDAASLRRLILDAARSRLRVRARHAEARSLARRDPLTGLADVVLLRGLMTGAIERARRNDRRLAVLRIDLDHFQRINETHGRRVGDELLRGVASRLCAALRGADTVARAEGDEFIVLLEDLPTADAAATVVSKLRDTLAAPFRISSGGPAPDHELSATASVGIAVWEPKAALVTDDLVRRAGVALARVKQQGRDGFRYYAESMEHGAADRLPTAEELTRAVEREELTLAYQPQLDLRTRKVVLLSAVVRWDHERLGLLHADRFLPLAAERGLLGTIEALVLERALRELADWRAITGPTLRVAVRLSATLLRRGSLRQAVERACGRAHLPASALLLELPESALIEDVPTTDRALAELAALGVGIAVDEFGTGYSSIAHLRSLPLEALHLAPESVHGLAGAGGRESASLVDAVVQLAASLGLVVTAAGVENEEQLEALRERGCDLARGEHLSPALPPAAVPSLLSAPPPPVPVAG